MLIYTQADSCLTNCISVVFNLYVLISYLLSKDIYIKSLFYCYNNGLRSSPLLTDDCDPDVLGCSVAELSPINAVELVDPSVTLWLRSDERPALLGRL